MSDSNEASQTGAISQRSAWRWVRRGLIMTLVFLALARVWFEIVPRGAHAIPWLMARVDGPELTSPAGVRVRVYYNDAGAMHSGNHWTWVVARSWLWGPYVAGEGWVTTETTEGQLQTTWVDGYTLSMPFVSTRRYGTPVSGTVNVK